MSGPVLPQPILTSSSPNGSRLRHDESFLAQRGGLHLLYEEYRSHLMLPQRRTGERVAFHRQELSENTNGAPLQLSIEPVYSLFDEEGGSGNRGVANARAAQQEEEFSTLHAARLCAQLHTLRAALTSSQQPPQVSPTVSHHRSPLDDGARGNGSPPISSSAFGGRANRTSSVASATELMELFRNDQLNPDTTPSPPTGLVRTDSYQQHQGPRVHVVVPQLMSTSSSCTTTGALGGGASSDCSAIPPASLRTKSTSPVPLQIGRRRSSGTNPAGLPVRQRRPPLSGFARQRVGQLLADVVIACAAMAEGAQLENVEDLLVEVPALVLSMPSQDDNGSKDSSSRSRGKFSPLGTDGGATSAATIQQMVKSARSFMQPPGHHQHHHRGHERVHTDGEDSTAPPPFLNFDVVNSAEDLSMFEDEASDWGSGSREQPHLQTHVRRHNAAMQHHHPSYAYPTAHLHHAGQQLQSTSASAHSRSATSPSTGPNPPPASHTLPPAPSSNSLLSPHSNSTSHRQLMAGLGQHHQRSASAASGAQRHLTIRSGVEHPHSPNSSILFRPALSFTSVESPRRRPPSASPQGLHFSLSPPPTLSYSVDEGRLHVFLQSLQGIVRLVSEQRISPRDFTEFGLRYTVPGIFCLYGSLAPTPQHGALFVPPALSGLAGFLQDAISLPASAIEQNRHSDPLGLPPKSSSQEALDSMAGAVAGAAGGQISRMSSFRAAAASPTAESIPIVDNGHQRIVTLSEFPIFLAAVKKTLMDVDAATGKAYNLSEMFERQI